MLPVTASREEWLTARKELLIREKQLTHARDDVSQARRELPMVEVEENYAFDGPDGARTLLDLFEGRRQLIVHHFMWVWDLDDDGNETPQDTGCPSCSATADNIGNLAHLHARDTTLVAVSRAPYDKIAPFHARMGWTFPWYSSFGSSFNYDFHVTIDDRIAPVLLNFRDETELAETGNAWTPQRRGDYPGISTFLREGDTVFHTYTTMARGLEQPGGTHYYLDLTALGRQEEWEKPAGRVTEFGASAGRPGISFHDEYA
jgi:predicted dithiol-disulfide oxidoreductase (DUF899 family)